MAVIKARQSGTMVKEAVVLDMGDLRRQADQLRESARREAQRVIEEGRQRIARESQAVLEEARRQGFEEGRAKGAEQGRAQGRDEALGQMSNRLEQLESHWLTAATDWEQRKAALLSDARQVVLNVAMLFAEKVVQRVIAVDPTVIADQVAEALAYVLSPSDVRVRLHPGDRPLLDEALPQLMQGLANVKHVSLVEDDAVSRGGCMVDFDGGRIDAAVRTQLDRLAALLLPDAPPVTDVQDDEAAAAPMPESDQSDRESDQQAES